MRFWILLPIDMVYAVAGAVAASIIGTWFALLGAIGIPTGAAALLGWHASRRERRALLKWLHARGAVPLSEQIDELLTSAGFPASYDNRAAVKERWLEAAKLLKVDQGRDAELRRSTNLLLRPL